MGTVHDFLIWVSDIALVFLALLLVGGGVVLAVIYVVDVTQTEQAIRRNYPVIGRLRYFFEHIGVFFRQYFFAMDREELPFNRAQRSWVARSAKNIDSTLAFGSTMPINRPGDFLFLNGAFPLLESEALEQERTPIVFGGQYVGQPYQTYSFFNISAMSFGALSAPAITALSHGAKKAGIYLNTGEGAISPYHLKGGCDIVFQIGTAKYGVRDENGALSDEKLKEIAAIEQVRMFEIKLSQGAKPGKGGILPGNKVTDVIASTRGIPVGHDSISPNRHEDVGNVSDLLDMIERVRKLTGKPTGIKFVLGQPAWLDELFSMIHQRGVASAPDFITLDSADGGTGAAPQSLMDTMGQPIWSSLPVLVDKRNEYGLRKRIRIIASGKLVTPSNVAAALCLGADAVNSARGFMFALGCIQAMQCNQNTCPTGITTHDKKLQKGLNPQLKSERVANYAKNMLHEVGVMAHSCGVLDPHRLERQHAAIVSDAGVPEPLNHRYPDIMTLPQFRGDTDTAA
ncbi:glutamate synthase domain 2 [Luminiphilus syltensis NOR5-1B]|uniref:Glutamate synthase domain 2 n=1 Tax=Luminiphilus syltensis NOR5-1B TaxID=565045 RepID=B8KXC1_9GAMM|nr:FMN-binding glutamate synthase family protein [Luminiphilus syltensis]EED34468.1 glutamate synthase domain 2 [Luminiphilus syltensis NOR5-1B]